MEKKGIPVELPLLIIRIWWYGYYKESNNKFNTCARL